MPTKEELEDYEEEVALHKAIDMFEGGTVSGQNWRSSLLEAHVNSLVGAPLAIVAHVALLLGSGIPIEWDKAWIFATASWPVFFYLSVGRIFLFRRIFERFGFALEPITLFRKLYTRITYAKTQEKET